MVESVQISTVGQTAINELCEAIRLTIEYTGTALLPPIAGWEWYDALVKYAPESAAIFKERHSGSNTK